MIIRLPKPKYYPFCKKTVYPFAVLPRVFTILESDRSVRRVIVWLERFWQEEEHYGDDIRIISKGPLIGKHKVEYEANKKPALKQAFSSSRT